MISLRIRQEIVKLIAIFAEQNECKKIVKMLAKQVGAMYVFNTFIIIDLKNVIKGNSNGLLLEFATFARKVTSSSLVWPFFSRFDFLFKHEHSS